MENDIPYLTLNPDIEEAIQENRAANWHNPYAFDDADIVRRTQNPHDEATLARPAFSRDIEKILNLPAYNRYNDKTQVFSFAENDDICRRGLHVQLVSRVARSIGRLLGLNLDLIEAIALGHDLGHTPFGHAGERCLSTCLEEYSNRSFRHNLQSVRVMDTLYRRNISLQTLDGALCHNGEFAQQKLLTGTMTSFDELDQTLEACSADTSQISHLRPSTLEGCVVRVCDIIAYLGKDRQDALRMKVCDSLDVFDSDYIGRTNAQIINNMTVDIVNNSYGRDHIEMSEEAFHDLVRAKRQNYQLIYGKEGMAHGDKNIVAEMFEEMFAELYRQLTRGDENSPIFRHHVNQLTKQSRTLTREAYLSEDPAIVVSDYISSMTDSYFMSLYRFLFPKSTKHIDTRGYTDRL